MFKKIKKIFFYLLGLKNQVKLYGYSDISKHIINDQEIKLTTWLHPNHLKPTPTSSEFSNYQKYIRNGDFCIDIGAHDGIDSILMGLAAGREGIVLAFEPNHCIFHVLQENIALNKHLMNINPQLLACGEDNRQLIFGYSDEGYCNGGGHNHIHPLKHRHFYNLTVYSINLEDYLNRHFKDKLSRLTFIKIDTEGNDFLIVKNIRKIIESYRPRIKMEIYIHTQNEQRIEIFTFFNSIGYKMQIINDDHLEIKFEEVQEYIPSTGHLNLLCSSN